MQHLGKRIEQEGAPSFVLGDAAERTISALIQQSGAQQVVAEISLC